MAGIRERGTKMRDNKTLDKIFDELIDEAASIVAENLGKNMPEPEAIEFSKEHENTMRKIFRKEMTGMYL